MSCVMSRPPSPPIDLMYVARDFLYWLNHSSCSGFKQTEASTSKRVYLCGHIIQIIAQIL